MMGKSPASPLSRLSRLRPEIFNSLFGFDREAFHEQFNSDIVRFFEATLR